MSNTKQDFLLEFIGLYKQQPELWNTKIDDYYDKYEKQHFWSQLLLKYQRIDKDATMDIVKKKANYLRSSYRRHLRKLSISGKTQDGEEPTLPWFFEHLDFLREHQCAFAPARSPNKRESNDSRRFTLEFIEFYKTQTVALWDKNSPVARNKTEKHRLWLKLVEKYREIDKKATIEDVKRKINNFRRSYRRELSKIRDSEMSKKPHTPTLWYFKNLEFLRESMLQAETVVEADTDSSDTTETLSSSDLSSSNQKTAELIEAYKNEPALWKTDSPDYKSETKRQMSWNNLLATYQEFDGDATIDAVKVKIYRLRFGYRRELKKVLTSQKTAEYPEYFYKPLLWYFDKMEFLRNHEEIDESDDSSNETPTKKRRPQETAEILSNSSGSVMPPFKRKLEDTAKLSENVAGNSRGECHSQYRDDAAIFAEGWAAMYRKLSTDQQLFAKRIIEDALIQGQLHQLTLASQIYSGESMTFAAGIYNAAESEQASTYSTSLHSFTNSVDMESSASDYDCKDRVFD